MSQILFTLLCSSLLFSNTPQSNAPSFEAAELISATDLSYPVQSIAVGTVVLETTVNEKGAVEDVRPIREIQSLTETALHAVKQLHFKPAILDGQTVRSRTTVAVVFNSVATHAYETALGPISETEARSDSSLEPKPISVTAASFVRYPPNTQTTGTVVLRAAIDTEGSVERVAAIRDVPALTEPCVETLKRWKFRSFNLLSCTETAYLPPSPLRLCFGLQMGHRTTALALLPRKRLVNRQTVTKLRTSPEDGRLADSSTETT